MDLFGDNHINNKIKDVSLSSRREIKSRAKMLMRDEHCKKTIVLPDNDEIVSYVSRGMSDAGSFLYAVNEIEGVIEEAVIATWTISKKNVLKIIEFIDNGKIKKLTFLMNDGLLKTNSTKPIYALMVSEFGKRKDKITYSVVNSHAKIQMYKTANKYFTISGSGNWSENPRIENYILIGGKQHYDFNVKWIKDLM